MPPIQTMNNPEMSSTDAYNTSLWIYDWKYKTINPNAITLETWVSVTMRPKKKA